MSLFSLLFVRSVGHTAYENQKLIARKSASSSSVVRATVGIFSQLFVSLSKRNNLNNRRLRAGGALRVILKY